MGYIAHHAIVFHHWRDDSTFGPEARALIRETVESSGDDFESPEQWDRLFVEAPPIMNGGHNYALLPDGSKEGWGTSHMGNLIRDKLIDLADALELDYVEVRFGGDDPDLAHEQRYNRRKG